jgi:pimeloyl-ACP methyl ester carboxylesterase
VLRTFAGGRLFGSVSGKNAPVVLALHGWARSHHDFDAVLRPADGSPVFDAVALDLPGFGATPPPPDRWGAADYAACVSGALDDMARPVVVVGHSFGGRVAVHLAARCPAAVRALVLTGVPFLRLGPPLRPARGYRLVRVLHRAGLVGEDRMERARQRYGSTDYRAAEGIMRQVHVRSVNETYEDQLDAVACPVDLVWGEDDTVVPIAVAEAALERLARSPLEPAATLERIPGAGHLVPLTAPGALRAALERHLG